MRNANILLVDMLRAKGEVMQMNIFLSIVGKTENPKFQRSYHS